MHTSLCLCALLPRLALRTRVALIIHRNELRKPTNTGRLAIDCLENSERHVRGERDSDSIALTTDPQYRTVLLFPAEDAVSLESLVGCDLPTRLVVPDGNWRQAGKMRKRVPGLSELVCARLPPGAPTTYRLRHETHDEGLATMEAIARALGVLEGASVEAELMRVFTTMVERTLWLRGAIEAEAVTGGLPTSAISADPRGGIPR